MIICIGREYGSGGREIGNLLAESLGIPFFDRELVDKAVKYSSLSPELLEKADEKKTNLMLYQALFDPSNKELRGLSANDIIFRLQSKVILEHAEQGSAVFIGRCADYVLRQAQIPCHSVFICAPFSVRIKRITRLLQKDEKSAVSIIQKLDKQRSSYYNYYTNGNWSKPSNYDLCVNSAALGTAKTAQWLKEILLQTENFA